MDIFHRVIVTILVCSVFPALAESNDIDKLIHAMKNQTPIIEDLQQLTDEIGPRLTGTKANEQSLDWAIKKFKQAGIQAQKESFEMPKSWSEQSASAIISGKNIHFSARVAAMPFTKGTSSSGLTAAIVDIGKGDLAAFKQSHSLKDKWLLVETAILDDKAGIHGLFQEYVDSVGIEQRAIDAQAAGLIYMSSRPKNLLYRHLPSKGADSKLTIVVMEREQALKVKRLLSKHQPLVLNAKLDITSENTYQTHNVIAEIKGSTHADEIVLIGAHIDSFDLGTGALDNGSNVALVIDIARQIKKLNIAPKRTIRFALYNGEEQGIYGSWGYTKTHIEELNKHVMTATIDIGTGKISGFFTNGRADIIPALNKVLQPVVELGPFEQINVHVVGTDNYDFMMNGVANIVANQQDANYASNYHAQSDTFDKVDQKQLKLNAAIMAAMTLGFANLESITWKQQTTEQVEAMVQLLDIEASMKTFGLYKSWKNKTRPVR
ncbi:M28 family peptidase [Thalassotalea psychrophila]|uniref:Carboxypeptidase Q n=1 Tax=Thalassotalea psychrophila TaxID=3065647 RepID=A0ABY9TX66_9GAMM|nr:M28 family peptidase [Colwelliaceae bacterium SQ149]